MFETLKRYLRYTSWPIIAAMIALMVIGVLAIRAAEAGDPTMRGFAARQVIYVCVAAAGFMALTLFPYQRVGKVAYPLFGVTLAVLVAMIVPKFVPMGGFVERVLPSIRGSRRWIDLGVVQVQPSEFAKLTFIIMLAWYLRRGSRYRRLSGLILPFVLTFVPMGLILIEPDLGTSLLLLPTLYVMLFMAGAKLRHLGGIVALATALVFVPVPRDAPTGSDLGRTRANLAYWTMGDGENRTAVLAGPLAMMEAHQIARIEGWLRQDDPAVAMGKGYHLQQSKRVLGSGMLTGRSDWRTSSSYFRMLPDDHTDFIFSIVGGQWGFVGCAGLLVLYGVIFLFGIEIAVVTYDPFGRLLAVGVLALLFAQICINVGMTMGLMPITGMTLPLVSYGGSSLVVNGMALGLLVNVGQRRPILLSRRPFEFGPRRERLRGPESPIAGAGRTGGSKAPSGGSTSAT